MFCMKTFGYLFSIFILVNTSPIYTQVLPGVGIKKIHINDKILHPPFETIILQPNEDDLSIYFIDTFSIDLYEYQLLGLDETTIKSKIPYTRYTNLKGNDYVFTLSLVKDGDTSKTIKLPIKVLPKTTESTWFIPALVLYISLVIIALTFLWLMYHYRQKMRVYKIRDRIAADLHDEIGSILSSIAILSKTLKRDLKHGKPELLSTLDDIIHSAEHTNRNLHHTVWFLKPELDNTEELLEKIRSIASQVFTAKGIHLTFDANLIEIKNFSISMLQRRNVYLIACEAINNIVKHSMASEVLISVKKEGRKIRMIIQDNGKGFEEVKEGNGLKNFQQRAKESFIKFDLKSQLDKGTTVTMLIPQL